MSRIWLEYLGSGPASKVSTTSRSASGSVLLYCMVPMMGWARGSTTMVRHVPMASGWPGHSAADAACAATEISRPTQTVVQGRRRSPPNTLVIIEPRLHSKSTHQEHATAYIWRHECRLNHLISTLNLALGCDPGDITA